MSVPLSTVARKDWSGVATSLANSGFAVFDGNFLHEATQPEQDAQREFVSSCRNLPRDHHSPSQGRNRRHGIFILNPETNALDHVPPAWDEEYDEFVSYYQQSDRFNPEHGGKRRCFAALTDEQYRNTFLRNLLVHCFRVLPWRFRGEVSIGVHIVEFVAAPDQIICSSPSKIHQDGEPFTWAFLIGRNGIEGGENIIATADSVGCDPDEISENKTLARFTLGNELDGWVVDDRRLSHCVSSIRGLRHTNGGWRRMLLIDFSPVADVG